MSFYSLRRRFCALILLLLFVFSLLPMLFSCGESEKEIKPQKRIFYEYFDTVCVIYDYTGMEKDDLDTLMSGIESSLEYYHRLFDIYHEYEGISNLATVNRLAGQGPVKVSREICEMLTFSKEMYGLTHGRVNVAMGSVLSLWHKIRALPEGERYIPTESELSSLGEHTSIDSIVIDTEALTVEITDAECSLDVGAIAKGYAAERIKAELIKQGYSGIVLDLGGNLCTVGSKPGGEGWTSGIRNPLYPDASLEPYVRTVTLLGGSLVTSGVYERYFILDGRRYHHIIDPETLMPEQRYLSVSVMAKNSALCDALSTAVFNMSREEAEFLIAAFDSEIEITLVYPDGEYTVLS